MNNCSSQFPGLALAEGEFGGMAKKYYLCALITVSTIGFVPSRAAAEGNCPAGHYPTYDQNGVQNGCYPAYDPNARSQAAGAGRPTRPARPNVPVKNFFAGAWHIDARETWIASGYRTPETAEKAALAACQRVMGNGCTVGFGGYNLSVALARGSRGLLYASTEANDGKAKESVLNYCRKQRGCKAVTAVDLTQNISIRIPVPVAATR